MILVGLLVSLFLLLWSILRNIQYRKQLTTIHQSLHEIVEGNKNRRIHLHTTHESIRQTVILLNRLLEQYQKLLERKKSEETIQKKFFSNISHDLYTPLTSLLGYIEALHQDKELTPQEQKEYLTIIYQKAQFLQELMENFFQLSMLEAKDKSLRIERVEVVSLIQETLLLYYEDFLRIGVEPSVIFPQEPLMVLADAQAIKRILTNLISNYLKYGTEGKKFGITIREETKEIWVEVWDNGRGIPAHELEHIFERLYTLESSRNKRFQGNGLGLTIVKQLVEAQNGKILVESTPYQMTKFSFSLPKSLPKVVS